MRSSTNILYFKSRYVHALPTFISEHISKSKNCAINCGTRIACPLRGPSSRDFARAVYYCSKKVRREPVKIFDSSCCRSGTFSPLVGGSCETCAAPELSTLRGLRGSEVGTAPTPANPVLRSITSLPQDCSFSQCHLQSCVAGEVQHPWAPKHEQLPAGRCPDQPVSKPRRPFPGESEAADPVSNLTSDVTIGGVVPRFTSHNVPQFWLNFEFRAQTAKGGRTTVPEFPAVDVPRGDTPQRSRLFPLLFTALPFPLRTSASSHQQHLENLPHLSLPSSIKPAAAAILRFATATAAQQRPALAQRLQRHSTSGGRAKHNHEH